MELRLLWLVLAGVLLVPVLEYQEEAVRGNLARLNGRTGGEVTGDVARDSAAFLSRLQTLLSAIEIPGVDALELSPADHELISDLAEANGSNTSSPMPMRAADYRRILTG